MNVTAGAILTLEEVFRGGFTLKGKSVRVLGRMVDGSFDVVSAQALIEHEGYCLRVDVHHLPSLSLRSNSLYSFIGELDRDEGIVTSNTSQLILHARVGRNMDGLDEALFYQVMMMRRNFGQRTSTPL
eukprot:TRINITY_DN8372_c0_g1_i3.p1 TRINITY_DN8372_c0_g1~~TRINITY_DN8372_c0_g1_i3.p1  ORF type:complete len:128 (+),score=10.12 TRINITY_DN8372_c0_g1_i3:279-662(+)